MRKLLFMKIQNRDAALKFSSIIGLIGNLILVITKLSIGFMSGSLALISDGFNNLLDFSNSIITLITSYIASKPADENHPFGHGRAEYIATQFVSFFIIYIGITIIIESIQKLLNPSHVQYDFWFYIVLILSVLIKLLMTIINSRLNKQYESPLLKAVIVDSKMDVYSSLLLLGALLIQPFVKFPIDTLSGVIIALILIYQGIQLLKNTFSELLGRQLSETMIHKINQIINQHPSILGYHNLKGHDYGPNHIHVSVDIELPDTTNLVDAHRIVDEIERHLSKELNIDVVCHIDPISSDQELNDEMYQIVLGLGLTPSQISRFSCVRGHLRTSIFLSLKAKSHDEFETLKNLVHQNAVKLDRNLSFHFSMDGE